MREILDAVADGTLDPAEAEAELRGYTSTDAGRFDAARTTRSGVPEAVLAAGKTPTEIETLATASLETTGRAIVTRLDDEAATALKNHLDATQSSVTVTYHERARTLTARVDSFEGPDLDASVGIVTAGTADGMPASEAAVVAREMGATVERVDDIGVAALSRLLDTVEELREYDVLIVAAGREGALPTVVAGLVDVPVIGLPVSSGYGHGGDGKAALLGLLQSCTALSTVNVDAGFTAGAQAGLFARALDSARADATEP
jgi:NCAIR mutase (PurE)-related protein